MFFEPGGNMPAWMWDPQIQYFAGHYHVVALDPRSQGDSDKPLEGNSPERRAQDIKELVDHLKLAPVVLVGWPLAAPELLSYAEQFGGGQVRAYVARRWLRLGQTGRAVRHRHARHVLPER